MTSNYDIFDLDNVVDDLIDMTDGDVNKIDDILKDKKDDKKDDEKEDENEIPLF